MHSRNDASRNGVTRSPMIKRPTAFQLGCFTSGTQTANQTCLRTIKYSRAPLEVDYDLGFSLVLSLFLPLDTATMSASMILTCSLSSLSLSLSLFLPVWKPKYCKPSGNYCKSLSLSLCTCVQLFEASCLSPTIQYRNTLAYMQC